MTDREKLEAIVQIANEALGMRTFISGVPADNRRALDRALLDIIDVVSSGDKGSGQ